MTGIQWHQNRYQSWLAITYNFNFSSNLNCYLFKVHIQQQTGRHCEVKTTLTAGKIKIISNHTVS